MGASFSSIMSSWDYSHPPATPEQPENVKFSFHLGPRLIPASQFDIRPLDTDGGEDFEPHYVGATAERDALVLSAIANLNRPDTSEGADSPRQGSTTNSATSAPASTFRVRQVSTNPEAPVFFLFERAKPYGDDNAYHHGIMESFLELIGRENIERLFQKFATYSHLLIALSHDTP
jgi:hypothetical protein